MLSKRPVKRFLPCIPCKSKMNVCQKDYHRTSLWFTLLRNSDFFGVIFPMKRQQATLVRFCRTYRRRLEGQDWDKWRARNEQEEKIEIIRDFSHTKCFHFMQRGKAIHTQCIGDQSQSIALVDAWSSVRVCFRSWRINRQRSEGGGEENTIRHRPTPTGTHTPAANESALWDQSGLMAVTSMCRGDTLTPGRGSDDGLPLEYITSHRMLCFVRASDDEVARENIDRERREKKRRRKSLVQERTAYGIRRTAYGIWRTAYSVRRAAYGVRYLAHGTLHEGIRHA